MDTRNKIVSPEAALAAAREARAGGKRIKLVSGYFDPLLAAHAARIEEIAAPESVLFAAVCEPVQPVLKTRARAELVAGLAMIDYVVLCADSAAREALDALQPDDVYREEAADERRTQDLILHVQERHS